jgi:hypothetical protein
MPESTVAATEMFYPIELNNAALSTLREIFLS